MLYTHTITISCSFNTTDVSDNEDKSSEDVGKEVFRVSIYQAVKWLLASVHPNLLQ